MQPQGMLRRTYQITLRRLMILVVFLALVLGLLRHALRHWGTSEVVTLAVTILVVTNVLAWFQKARWQVFWAGFGIFAWSYLVISLKLPTSDYLPTTWLLDNVHESM